MLVQRREHIQDLRPDVDGTRQRERPVRREPVGEVTAGHERHHDREGVGLDHEVEDPDQVRMSEIAQDGSLLQEAVHHGRVLAQVAAQDLDRDLEPGVAPPASPDLAAAAAAEHVDQLITAAESARRGRRLLAHHSIRSPLAPRHWSRSCS